SAPAPPPAQPAQPKPAPVPAPVEEKTENRSQFDGRTTEVESGRLTTHHQVVKEPAPVRQEEPPRPAPMPVPKPAPQPMPQPAPQPMPQPEPVRQPTAQTEAVLQPVLQHTAQTEAVAFASVAATEPVHEVSKPHSADEVQLFGFGGYIDTLPEK